ncbi:hypothetical protein V9W64_05620 [Neisseria leonii]|uniref:Lipoprotein n=1 Tax=Neisseria leonii TaxID=2995413 RepID=A0A9X4E3S0_9NEIS|nr:hypothetical protein [Neisseria sp. 51.81]MDD9328174.1 hypothetical protein [Neisseria sp. 51.81]
MKNRIAAAVFGVAAAAVLTACGTVSANPWRADCPEPVTDGRGMLAIKDGRTLKCQIKVFTSNMACTDKITNPAGDDGYACTNAANEGAVFFFDKNGVLKSHEFLQR